MATPGEGRIPDKIANHGFFKRFGTKTFDKEQRDLPGFAAGDIMACAGTGKNLERIFGQPERIGPADPWAGGIHRAERVRQEYAFIPGAFQFPVECAGESLPYPDGARKWIAEFLPGKT